VLLGRLKCLDIRHIEGLGDGYGILLNNRYPKKVAELNERLDKWADAVAQSFDMANIEALETSEEHAKRVEAITGALGLNRKNEHALTCATISYLVGIEVADELRHGIETLAVANEEYEDEIEEINSAILRLVKEQSPIQAAESVTLKQSTVKDFINEVRDKNHRKPLGPRRFAEAYRAAGIKTSWIRGRGGRNYWVIPMRHLQVLEGLVNSPNLPNLAESLVQQSLKVDQVGLVASLIEDFDNRMPFDELESKYGPELVNHCVESGIIPKIGGRP
jgi:hypothetical protein